MTNGRISFGDILGQDLLSGLAGTLTPARVLITLFIACLVGLFVLLVYRKTYSGVLYSHSFGLSLVMMTMLTALVIMPITSNLTLSLGMVGALSIVRFRTAVKDAMDTMYLFWCVGVGICLGARFYAVAVIGSLAVALVMLLLTSVKIKTALPFLLVLHYREEAAAEVKQVLTTLPKTRLKSKTARGDSVEMTLEIRLRDNEDTVVERFMKIAGVRDASLMSYQGDLIA